MTENDEQLETPGERQPDSVGADLADALAQYESAQTADAGAEPAGEGRARDANGRFLPKEAAAEQPDPAAAQPAADPAAAAAEKPAGEPPEQPAEQPGEAPHHWNAQDKAMLAAIPAAHRPGVVSLVKRIEAGYAPKLQEAASLRRDYGEVSDLFAPYRAQMQQQGWTPASLIKAWAGVEQRLMQGDGLNVVREIAQTYKLDLGQLAGAPAAQPAGGEQSGAEVPPVVRSLEQKIAELESQWTQAREAERGAKLQETVNQISAFKDEKDAAGQPLRPHFDDVLPLMQTMAAAERQAGRTPNLAALYDQAVWAHPETRARLIAAQTEAESRKRAEEAKSRAATARRAGASVAGAPGVGGASAPKGKGGTIMDDLRAAAEDAGL